MSLKTQRLGQKITTQFKARFIWAIDNKLWLRERTTKTESKFNFFVREIETSPNTGDGVPLVVDTICWSEDFMDWIWLLLKVMWFVALESIIHSLWLTGVEVWRALPTFLEVAMKDEAFSGLLVETWLGSITATEAWWFIFEFHLQGALAKSHNFGYPINS